MSDPEDAMTDGPSEAPVDALAKTKETNARILADYVLWKKNTPFLYDMLMIRALEWPSLAVHWLPGDPNPRPDKFAHQGLLISTHAPAPHENFLIVADVKLPLRQRDSEDDDAGTRGSFLNPVRQIPVPGPVCRACYMPQNMLIVAVAMLGSGVAVIRNSRLGEENTVENGKGYHVTPLKGFEGKEATFGLSWSPVKAGKLLAGSVDGSLCIWDVAADDRVDASMTDGSDMPTSSTTGESIMDACFHPKYADVAGLVRCGKALLWDTRTATSQSMFTDSGAQLNCLSFCATQESNFVTGGSDGRVCIWDIRNTREPLRRLVGHHGAVLQVQWSPCMEGIIASTAQDRRIFVWDITRVGRPQTPEERAEGPPELLFIHGGHTALVTDMCWNPHDPLTMASVARDNILQIWQPASTP